MSWWTPDREAYAYNYLTTITGLPPVSAVALISRWANVESTDKGVGSFNPKGSGAHGIAQWLGSTIRSLNVGTPGNTLDSQLAYFTRSLSKEPDARNRLMSAKTDSQAAAAASAYEKGEGSKELYPRDNFTGKTQQGMNGVRRNIGSAANDGSTKPHDLTDTSYSDATKKPAASSGTGSGQASGAPSSGGNGGSGGNGTPASPGQASGKDASNSGDEQAIPVKITNAPQVGEDISKSISNELSKSITGAGTAIQSGEQALTTQLGATTSALDVTSGKIAQASEFNIPSWLVRIILAITGFILLWAALRGKGVRQGPKVVVKASAI